MNTEKKAPRSVAELSHAVRDMLAKNVTGSNRFESMDLCEEIMNRSDLEHESLRPTLRSWIGKIQDKFQR